MTTVTTKRVIWNDGHQDSARTWWGLERVIRMEQYHRFTRRTFRAEMARRALVWSGATVDVSGSSEAFLASCEEAGLFRLEEEEER